MDIYAFKADFPAKRDDLRLNWGLQLPWRALDGGHKLLKLTWKVREMFRAKLVSSVLITICMHLKKVFGDDFTS